MSYLVDLAETVMIKPRHLAVCLFASSIAAFGKCHYCSTRRFRWTICLSSTKDTQPNYRESPASCNVASESLSRVEGRSVVNRLLLPAQDYDKRSSYARDAQGVTGGSILTADDPVLSMAYGEFPLESFDELLDLAMINRAELLATESSEQSFELPSSPLELVDLGSGCGRLVFYVSLTRGGRTKDERPWSVHGIEAADELHQEALRSVNRGIEAELFQPRTTSISTTESLEFPESETTNTFSLHLGSVADYSHVLHKAQVLFAYSSAFPASGFSEELSAMLLDTSWSRTLAERCRPGCVAITTDRVLDPKFGWKLLDQKSVDNREICGSIGYIQVLT